jgi:hypothetical protein
LVIESVSDPVEHDLVVRSQQRGDSIFLAWAFQVHAIPALVGMTWPEARALLAAQFKLDKGPGDDWRALNRQVFLRVTLRGDTTRRIIRQRPVPGAIVHGLPPLELTFGRRLVDMILPLVLIVGAPALLVFLAVVLLGLRKRARLRPFIAPGPGPAPAQESGEDLTRAPRAGTSHAPTAGVEFRLQDIVDSVREASTAVAALKIELDEAKARLAALDQLGTRLDTIEAGLTASQLHDVGADLQSLHAEIQNLAAELRALTERTAVVERAAAPAGGDVDIERMRAVARSVIHVEVSDAVAQVTEPRITTAVSRLSADTDAKLQSASLELAKLAERVGGLESVAAKLNEELAARPPVDLDRVVSGAADLALARLINEAKEILKAGKASAAAPVPPSRQTISQDWFPEHPFKIKLTLWFLDRAKAKDVPFPVKEAARVSARAEPGEVVVTSSQHGDMWLVDFGREGLGLFPDPKSRRAEGIKLCFGGWPSDEGDLPRLRLCSLGRCDPVGSERWRLVSKGRVEARES